MGILDKLTSAGAKVATAPDSEAAGIKAKSGQISDYMKATSGEPDKPKATPVSSDSDKLHPTSKYGDQPGEKRIDVSSMTKPLAGMASYAKGTTKVKKTGPAILHKGEAVVPAHENPMNKDKDKDMYGMVKDMAGKDAKPKKEIRKIHTSKTHDNKFLHVHEHHNSAAHPDEQHVSNDVKEMQEHMAANEPQMTASPSPMPEQGAAPIGA